MTDITASSSAKDPEIATVAFDEASGQVTCHGEWTVMHIHHINAQLHALRKAHQAVEIIDGSHIDRLDSAGALLLNDLLRILNLKADHIEVVGLKGQQQVLFKRIEKRLAETKGVVPSLHHNVFYYFGFWFFEKLIQMTAFINFTGEVTVLFCKNVVHPLRIAWRDLLGVMQETGYRALGIIALMSFLIGIVLAYQLATQLRQYGANIFIVDATGIAILREFAPLITAVIMAGRTSTAFAALIGAMKVNEEIDALRTMGIEPVQRLVLPRMTALILTLPLLVVWADLFGILGSMIMAKSILGISFTTFLQRFDYAVSVRQYVLGLIKTPVFAMVIAGVGCFQGFSVGNSADSVGRQTTKAAVQSIFLIIIVDALFSIIYSWMNL